MLTWMLVIAGATPLVVGENQPLELDGEAARLEVDMEAGTFFAAWVDQQTVDVVVRVLDPNDEEVLQIDGPALGRERVRGVATSAGTWTLEVQGFEGGTGRVDVLLTAREPAATELEDRVRQHLRVFGADEPGGAVAIVVDGEVQALESFGMADLGHGVPFEADTPTNIGSMSKQLTAATILSLVREGSLDLDAPIGPHVPELPNHAAALTLRQLLQHRSGLRDMGTLLGLTARQRISDGPEPLLRMLAAQPALQHEPGAEFIYNNSGYELATLVAERATGRSWEALIQDAVLTPHGMTSTHVRTGPYVVVPHGARGYARTEDGWIELPDDPGGRGAGGVYASVDDLTRWVATFDGALKEDFAVMTTPEGRYGMGFFVDRFEGLDRIHHGGDDGGFHSMVRYFPSLNAAVLTVVNSQQLNARGLADDLARMAFAAHLAPDEPGLAPAAAPAEEPWTPTSDALQRWPGRYACDELGIVLTLVERDGRLVLEHPFFAPRKLTPIAPGTFGWGAMRFHLQVEGDRATGMRVDAIRSRDLAFERIDPAVPEAPPTTKRRRGRR